ncbi:MAG: hypothetical protein K9M84_00255 [Spirochaetia bacterium]|nr:hypothetical protein [Spirochaetia bacterium]
MRYTREELDQAFTAVLTAVGEACSSTDEQLLRLRANETARLITLIPFLAGSDTPERDGASNLASYLLSTAPATKSYYLHTPFDDDQVSHRLIQALTISSGDQAVCSAGGALLALNMLTDYQRDSTADTLAGKYNPVASGIWDFELLQAALLAVFEPFRDLYAVIIDPDSYITTYWES